MNNKCIVCNCDIPDERLQFLLENDKELCCIKHAQPVKIKAIYSGEPGTSDLIFCDRVYNDSVRTKLYDSEAFNDLVDDELETNEEV
jgi:hypothetical protein